MAEEVKQEPKPIPKASKSKSWYFRNARMSALKVVTKRPKDRLDPKGEGREVVRFKAYYDTYKGDTVRVGYLEVTDKKVADQIKDTQGTEEITAKEYAEAMKELRPAPVRVA